MRTQPARTLHQASQDLRDLVPDLGATHLRLTDWMMTQLRERPWTT